MESLNEQFEKGQNMRSLMAQGDPSHYTLPGIDQLAPDLKRIINEALFGQIWTPARPGPQAPLHGHHLSVDGPGAITPAAPPHRAGTQPRSNA